LLPWAKDTPVQVRISRPRIHQRRRRVAFRRGVELLGADHRLHGQQQQRRATKPISGLNSSA
jgi:hypothetical protein